LIEDQSLASWLLDADRPAGGGSSIDNLSGHPQSGSIQRLHALAGLVEADLRRNWRAGHQVSIESYLEALPELGTRDTVPVELILAEYEERFRAGVPAGLAEYAARFPCQAEDFRRRADRSGGAAPESSPDPLGGSMDPSRNLPASLDLPPVAPVRLPRQFGRYRIIRRLGQGAMGTVYLAQDTKLDRRVALKIPHVAPAGARDGETVRDLDRFDREVRAAAALHHPNLCPVYDQGEIGGVYYLSMAYIKGRPLSARIDRERPLSQRWVAIAVRKLALALAEAHARGVIHRDLKPSNIMVDARRQLVIMDFGLAWRVGAEDARLTKSGVIVGTPAYMSPEQFSGDIDTISPRCDIYSLGVVFFELLTARRPFEGPTTAVMAQILYRDPPPPSRYRPDLDARLEAICLTAMAKKAEDRYATMDELAAALDRYLRDEPASPGLHPLASSPPDGITSVVGGAAAEWIAPGTTPPHDPPPGEPPPVPISREAPGQAVVQEESPGVPAVPPAARQDLTSPPAGEHDEDLDFRLKRLWRTWTEVVTLFALHRTHRRVDPADYAALHLDLVGACRSRLEAAAPEDRPLYEKLSALAEPWRTMSSVLDLDQEMSLSLLILCRQAEMELHGQPQAARELGERVSILRESADRPFSVVARCLFALGISLGLLLIWAVLILTYRQPGWFSTLFRF